MKSKLPTIDIISNLRVFYRLGLTTLVLLSVFMISFFLYKKIMQPGFSIVDDNNTTTTNTFVDPRDGQEYKTLQIGGNVWMAENLNYDIPGSWCYLELPKLCDKLGRLYIWEAAEKACPKGWHIPVAEEWNTLFHEFSLDRYQNETLIKEESMEMAFTLGGYRYEDGTYRYLDREGIYWSPSKTRSKNHETHNLTYRFDTNNDKVSRWYSSKTEIAISCRCIKD